VNGIALKDLFQQSFCRRPDRPAITFLRGGQVESVLTYGKLDRDTSRFANKLLTMGVGKGDRVVILAEKSLIAVVAHIAIQKLGAVTVLLNPGFQKAELDYLLKDADAKLVLTEPDKRPVVAAIDPKLEILAVATEKKYLSIDFFKSLADASPEVDVRFEDPALIIYTSGTTGKPKGAILTQQNLIHDAVNIIDIWKIRDTDVLCHALPLFHVHGLCFMLHTAMAAGAHLLMLDRFQPAIVLQCLSRRDTGQACTVFMAVPTMYARLVDDLDNAVGEPPDFSHLRLLTSGSAPLLVKDFERIKQIFGQEPVEREGMSETGMNFSNPLEGERKPGSIGLPLPGLEVRIVDPGSGSDLEPGQIGEIWLKGPGITPGYWRKPQETAEAFAEGWFRSGDLGRVDDDGYYYLTDRIKHIIISGGENISAKEVESVINTIEGVLESAVVGIPDEKWGEKVAAAVIRAPGNGLTQTEVYAACNRNLHKWKCPKEIVFVNQLPKNSMGKILKEEVRKLFPGSRATS
jgi:malonyl-CoA/methylmalonyl-CoA synthetase